MALQVTSTAFRDGDMLPARYACDGDGVSPPLAWSGAPEATESFVVTCEDHDAAHGPFIHWLVYGLPPSTLDLTEEMPTGERLATGGMQGMNSAQGIGYTGPCPPHGQTHRYQFRVFALDERLDLPTGATYAQVMRAMHDHVLAEGRLTAKFTRAGEKAA